MGDDRMIMKKAPMQGGPMLRFLTTALAATALFFQTFVVTDALARGGVAARNMGQAYGFRAGPVQFNAARVAHPNFQTAPFGVLRRFHALRNGQFPGGVVVGFPFDSYDDFLPVGDYLPEQGCILERRPVTTLYGLGWRTFNLCFN
jgi:hypothetical protein